MIILVPLGFILLLVIHHSSSGLNGARDWRDSLLFSYLGISVFFLLSCEGLSLFRAMNRPMMILVWSTALVFLLFIYRYSIRKSMVLEKRKETKNCFHSFSLVDWVIFTVLGAVFIFTGIIAYVVPPHDSDVLAYHMPRVVHWIQNQSVAFYAVPDARHLWMPPWPAYAQTNLYLLGGSDRFANMIQWSAMVISVISVSRIAAYLGSNIRGQLIAALFAATIPMGIYQASSSLTDYSAAAWVTVSGCLIFRNMKMKNGWLEWIGLGLSVALGYLTKGTYVLFVLPFVVWFAVEQIQKTKVSEWFPRGLVILLLILIMVMPFSLRSWTIFDSVMGPEGHIEMLSNERISVEGLVSNFFRQTAIQFASPSRSLNKFLEQSVEMILGYLKINPDNPSYSYQKVQFGIGWIFPGSDSGPIHAMVLLLCALISILFKPYRKKDILLLLLTVFTGYLIFCGYIRWQGTTRFNLAVYMLMAPVVGLVLGQGFISKTHPLVTALLVLYAVPSLFFLRWRPLITWKPKTAIESVFNLSRKELFFRSKKKQVPQYDWVSTRILQTGCDRVQMRTDSHDLEYLWWIELDPLGNDITIEHNLIFPGLEDLKDDDFQACALICTVCSDSPKERNGLWPVNLEDDIKLYLPEEYLEEQP